MSWIARSMPKMPFGAVVLALSAWAVAGLSRHSGDPVRTATLPPEHGAVYFRQWMQPQQLWSMRADGSGKVPLAAGVEGEPSGYLHSGHRWFLSVREVKGEAGPGGRPGRALFGVRDDGRSVRLALPADLEPSLLFPRWPLHARDEVVSWVGQRHGADGRVREGGIYAAKTVFDGEGNLVGLAEQPPELLVSAPILDASGRAGWRCDDRVPDVQSHDWSPDGTGIVFDTFGSGLLVAEVATGKVRPLTDVPGSDPTWSPDGEWIAFQVRRQFGGIGLVRPDGTRFRSVFHEREGRPSVAAHPAWSPSGEHLVCLSAGGLVSPVDAPCPVDVLVAARDGAGQQNLTSDLGEGMMPLAWRSNEEASEPAIPGGVAWAGGIRRRVAGPR